MLFVNGIPTATLELKSEFKQSADNAKRQYCKDRPVKDPLSRKPESLPTFKRGALVHFAASQQEVAMTTKLASNETFFLLFNMGSEEGGAGNPLSDDDSQYSTGYLRLSTTAGIGMVRFDQRQQTAPGHHLFHFSQKAFAPGLLALAGVFEVGKAHLAHGGSVRW